VTAFGQFLKKLKLKSVKVGPFTWDIQPTDASRIATAKESQEESSSEGLIQEGVRELDDLINSLENFHSNPEGIYYIGQTLVFDPRLSVKKINDLKRSLKEIRVRILDH